MTPSAATAGGSRLVAEYEQLRRQVLNGSGRGSRLIVFLHQGMRAWMEEELRSAVEAATPPEIFDTIGLCPQPSRAEVVLLLASMALGARKECIC
jgi:hypothetical protein